LLITKKKILRERLLEIRENKIKVFKSFQDDILTTYDNPKTSFCNIIADNSAINPIKTILSTIKMPINLEKTVSNPSLEKFSSLTLRIPKKLKLIKYSTTLLAQVRVDTNESENNKQILSSRNLNENKLGHSLSIINDFYRTTPNIKQNAKPETVVPILTPKTKNGKVFFNNYFIKSIISSLDNLKSVTLDKIPNKLNVIDCLAMDNYDRIYHNFYKYSKLINKDANKFKSVSTYKFTAEKTSLEDLYSKDLIISNKFLKNQEVIRNIKLPPINRKKMDEEKQNRPKMHYIYKNMKMNKKSYSSLYI
jgi:hypothetical protein